ncbi:ABC transporter ATP-binding protein [Pseudalkalibacillus berkeleyi]|uniref:ABC transporter ATP-binding protein/permease n=1 Tax=Pseudalkalibacillus berkeleyi TaxID=1069813 RepID=A0ABS9H5E7_9BACL|nr:ABC transporter ATP-binding protein [Pseudalkalibacillus berkeleyi]MCF6139042.1 ABC transporter ATP-binding protein/permease [Pseudalkalibacillus berkeleyi]
MRKVFSYLPTYKISVSVALSLMILELIVELFQPLIMAKIIDEGIVTKDMDVVLIWGGVLLGVSLIAFAAGITNSYFAAHASQGVGHDLRRDLFQKVQAFSSKHFQTFSTPGLVTRLTNDVTQVQGVLFMLMRIAMRAPLFIIGGIVMSFVVHPGLATILLLSVPIMLLFLFFILKKGMVLFRKVQERLDRINTVIRENLAGIRLIKGFNRGAYEEKRFKGVNRTLMDENKKALWVMEVAMPVVMLGMNVVIILILWFGAMQLDMNTVQAGELVAVINYATKIMFTFTVFTFLIMNYSRGSASAKRIEGVLEETTGPLHAPGEDLKPAFNGGIRFENVTYQLINQQTVLRNISFTIHPGETVGILGETGSGKTTLLNLIPRLLEHTEGKILIDETNINDVNIEYLRSRMSIVPQEAHLFSGRIVDNIRWGKEDATENEVVQAAKDAQIHDFIESLPEGYETLLGQKGVSLSGGQKQRLSIARALVRDPDILILDDSTSALDAHTEKRLLTMLKEKACTVILVAQKISSVRNADQILIIDDGEFIGIGNHHDLLRSNPYYQSVYESQMEEDVI